MKFAKAAALPVAAFVAVGLVMTGCGGDDEKKPNAADAAFISDMTAHHKGAIEMAELAPTRAKHSELRRLAGSIIDAQTSEVAQMKRLSTEMPDMGGHEGMNMSDAEMGMDLDMPKLRRARPFDREFIDMMVPHHRGAIAMARKQLKAGAEPGLRTMAEAIIAAQTREISQMRGWRKRWYGSAGD